jgi:DNA-binding NarL/FixJ family response regulator
VKKIKVLLAQLPPIVSGLLAYLIKGQPDMEIAGDVSGAVELLLATKRTAANVVILPLPDSGDVPGVSTHLLAEHPDLLILMIAVQGKTGWACRRRITLEPIEATPVENILMAIRTAESAPPPECEP